MTAAMFHMHVDLVANTCIGHACVMLHLGSTRVESLDIRLIIVGDSNEESQRTVVYR